jgi:hypothetical protein
MAAVFQDIGLEGSHVFSGRTTIQYKKKERTVCILLSEVVAKLATTSPRTC